jgi:thiamine-monophosphate kinase
MTETTSGAWPALSPDATIARLGERNLLQYLKSRIPSGVGVVAGVGDDAAVVETAPLSLLTTDAMVEGVHFEREWAPAHLLGRKALTINLSDIAAMGGTPRYATVSLCLPADVTLGWVDDLYDGLLERASETGVSIVGGNLSATGDAVVIDIMLLGQGERLLMRGGATPGDLVVVTGRLGLAAAGLRCLEDGARLNDDHELRPDGPWSAEARPHILRCVQAQLDPEPPLAFARAVAEQTLVHAAMDLSDGLSGDLLHMCQASGVAGHIDASAVPVDPSAAALEKEGGQDGFSLAVHGGEDYQLLLAVPRENLDALRDVAVVWDLPVTVVGEFTLGPPGVGLKFGDSVRRLRPKSHDHFEDPRPRVRRDPNRREA